MRPDDHILERVLGLLLDPERPHLIAVSVLLALHNEREHGWRDAKAVASLVTTVEQKVYNERLIEMAFAHLSNIDVAETSTVDGSRVARITNDGVVATDLLLGRFQGDNRYQRYDRWMELRQTHSC